MLFQVLLRVKAEHKYDEERADEISIMPGDIIKDVKKEQRDWWRGVHEKTGKEGQLRPRLKSNLTRAKTICTDKVRVTQRPAIKPATSFREKLMRKISFKKKVEPPERAHNYVTREDISKPLTEPERITAEQFPSLIFNFKTNKKS